jgi:hypothetical protein
MTDRSSDFTLAGIAFLILALAGLALTSPKAPYNPDNPTVMAYWNAVATLAGTGDA